MKTLTIFLFVALLSWIPVEQEKHFKDTLRPLDSVILYQRGRYISLDLQRRELSKENKKTLSLIIKALKKRKRND